MATYTYKPIPPFTTQSIADATSLVPTATSMETDTRVTLDFDGELEASGSDMLDEYMRCQGWERVS